MDSIELTRLKILEAKIDRLIVNVSTIMSFIKNEISPQEFYTTKQAAEYVGYSQDTIKRYCSLGIIKAELRRLKGRAKKLWYIAKAELDAFRNNTQT